MATIGARLRAKCQYPGCKHGLSHLSDIGLCPQHHEEAQFLIWLLSAKLRIGPDGPLISELLGTIRSIVEKGREEQRKRQAGGATLIDPQGHPL